MYKFPDQSHHFRAMMLQILEFHIYMDIRSGVRVALISAYIFCPQDVCLLRLLHIFKNAFHTNFIMQANIRNPDQTIRLLLE